MDMRYWEHSRMGAVRAESGGDTSHKKPQSSGQGPSTLQSTTTDIHSYAHP